MKYVDKEKAATVARVVSRLLRKNGFEMADTRNRYAWTEGYHVGRVGYSSSVMVGYHIPPARNHRPGAQREQIAKVRELLKSKGYEMDERGWIETEAR